MWLLDSANAHFQIDITIPDASQQFFPDQHYHPFPPPPTSTPRPETTVIAAERSLVTAILASFRPTAKPRAC